MSGPLHTVHVRVNDAATGRPTPVRIRFTNAAGEYFAPWGRLAEFATGVGEDVGGQLARNGKRWAYIDGTCEIRLPPDPLWVEIYKGPEYVPIKQETQVGTGKLALRFSIERWVDPRADGWYSGDTRAHFLSPHAALLEGAAEDLAVVNLLAMEWPPGPGRPTASLPQLLAFSGQTAALEMPGHQVVVNTFNDGGVLGALGLLNCHRAVFPLTIGRHPPGVYDWTLADWCDQCHRKHGLTVWTQVELDRPGRPHGLIGEGLADLVLGKIDAIEVNSLRWCREQHHEWYRFLNAGLRVPLVGGSGKVSNAMRLGTPRTYARLAHGEPFTYRHWIEAVRAGRTVVTNGPWLDFSVNGLDPGAVIDLPHAGATVRVHAQAKSLAPLERLELVRDGIVVAAAEAGGTPSAAVMDGDIDVPASGWLAARCWGPDAAAHSSPIYLQVEGRPMTPEPMAKAMVLELLDRMLGWVQNQASFDSPRRRQELEQIFEAARQRLTP
ncbi:MAG: CehA/McbA family metallohydrolase [Gemmataceae bacterium]|nr:CehA/McbA family metallohydrolase [Gemmataceae bacterium]MDW8266510.1 CehA/McbA family metallohydrolase [Gemmataceae bacterium]